MNAYEYKDDNIKPNTITFNNNNATWVMQITPDRKIIVNEDVEVTDAAKAVFDALQGYLTPQTKPLSDEEIREYILEMPRHASRNELLMFARAILRKAQEK